MRLKSYYAGTVEGAIAQARKELGDDVMLIHSRRTAPEFSHLGAYEVVFAITPAVTVKPPAAPAAASEVQLSEPRPRNSKPEYCTIRLDSDLTKLAASVEDDTG